MARHLVSVCCEAALQLLWVYHHHHHHPRISLRRKSWNKTLGPLYVTYYTTAVMSMLLWPIVCIAVWSAEQFCLQYTLECPQRRQRRDCRWQHIPNLCCGNREGAIADGPVQRLWKMQIADAYVTRCRRPAVAHCWDNVVLCRSYNGKLKQRDGSRFALMLSLCCGSPRSVKEFRYSVGKPRQYLRDELASTCCKR